MRLGPAGHAWAFVARLGSILGWHGLTSGLIALVAFGCGLGMLVQEYYRPKVTDHDVFYKVLANWVQAPDYLGKNIVDYARDWHEAPEASRPALLGRVQDSLRRLGDDLERHDTLFPLINVVGMSLVDPVDLELAVWKPQHAIGASTSPVEERIPVDPAGTASPLELVVRYQVAPEVESFVQDADRSYVRMIRALIALSGASLLCFGYMILHVLDLRERVAIEAAQEATLDLADRTCHELGNVAFVVANERRNLASHIELLERFVAEEPEARDAAASRAGIDVTTQARFNHALKREYADREIDPAFELRRSAALARDVCRQIAICSDYITLTVRELDGFLKQSELPVVLATIGAAEVFEEAVALLAPRLESADARVDRPGLSANPVRVIGDRRLLVHALVNLLKNAVEAASGAGIDPVIALSVRIDGETAWLEVADNGPGIAVAESRQIFEPGFSTKGAGRGQGLAIVRESVQLQGGRLIVSARPEGGTIFAIGLPVAT
jgi:signal transduction histidine kinase